MVTNEKSRLSFKTGENILTPIPYIPWEELLPKMKDVNLNQY